MPLAVQSPHPNRPPLLFLSATNVLGAYNSSKAAVHAIGDALRIEMYPFNVKVLNFVTGGVRTNLSPKMLTNLDLRLPDNSRYLPIEGYYKKRTGYSNANAISPEEYARQVVRAVDSAWGSGWIWRGYFAFAAWFLSTFFWRGIFDRFMIRTFGLGTLKKILDEKRKMK